jgi:hypothetical protein
VGRPRETLAGAAAGLRKDFSWAFTPAIVEWKHGDFADELVEVSHEQAERIVQYFRERWDPPNTPQG